MTVATDVEELRDAVAVDGYAFIKGEALKRLIDWNPEKWDQFVAHWDHLGEDRYLKGDYIFRRRRYGQIGYVPLSRKMWLRESAPYYQSEELNSYAGGIPRRFAPLTEEIVDDPVFADLVGSAFDALNVEAEYRGAEWYAEIHLFRLTVTGSGVTEPTPEGIHRDGFPFGAVHLISRENIEGGVSHIYTLDEQLVDISTLTAELDSYYAYDNRVKHFATPFFTKEMGKGHRDVLVYGMHLPGSKYARG